MVSGTFSTRCWPCTQHRWTSSFEIIVAIKIRKTCHFSFHIGGGIFFPGPSARVLQVLYFRFNLTICFLHLSPSGIMFGYCLPFVPFRNDDDGSCSGVERETPQADIQPKRVGAKQRKLHQIDLQHQHVFAAAASVSETCSSSVTISKSKHCIAVRHCIAAIRHGSCWIFI